MHEKYFGLLPQQSFFEQGGLFDENVTRKKGQNIPSLHLR